MVIILLLKKTRTMSTMDTKRNVLYIFRKYLTFIAVCSNLLSCDTVYTGELYQELHNIHDIYL